MELQTEDGRTIFLTRGCRKELGRGPGLTWKDRTVSRRQIVLELPGDDASIQILSKVYVEVVGANPICILRHGNAIQQVSSASASASASDGQGIEFLEKGSKGLLRVGDKLSLSIKEPSFLTLKVGSDEDQEQKKGSFLKKVAFLEEYAVQGAPKTAVVYDSTQLLKEEKENNDLLDAWRSRKLAKKGEASDCKAKGRSFQSDGDDSVQRSTYAFNEDGNSRQENQTRNCEILEQAAKQSIPIVESTNTTVSPAKDEEEGIAEAVARRKRLSLKRQEAQSKQLEDLEWKKSKKVDESEANTSKDNDEVDYREADHSEQMHNKLLQVDPVADLGFIVEGSEFDRFKGRKFDGRMLDWRIDKKRPDDNSEEEEKSSRSKKIKPGVSKKSLHGRTEVEDEDWQGENEDEKLLVAKVKKPRKEIEVQTRSKYNSGSDSDKQLKMTKRTKNKLAQFRKTDEEEDDLTGFIVEDDEEVDSDQGKDDDEDKDEWIDDEASENSQDGNLKAAKCLKKITKPLCIYGRNCYRKNKEHLLQFRHPKS